MFIGHLCLSLGRQDEARQWRRVAARLASAVDDAYFQTAHGVMSSMPLWLAGRFGAAVSRLGRYRAVTRRSGQEILRLQHQWAEALARAGRGEYAAAMTLLHAALEMSKQCGDPFWQGRCLNTLGWIHHELQEFTTALELNQQALQAAQAAPFPDPEVEGNTRLNLGDALLALGRWDDADLQFQAVEQVVRHPRPEEHWMLWRYAQHFFHSAGELALARGQLERAQALADECLAGAEATDSRKNVVKARRLRAQVFLARNQVAAADQEIGQALVLAEPLGNPPQLWRTYVALGEVRRAQDRARDAGAAYRAALGVVERVARGLGDPTLRERFQQSPHVRDIRRRLMERS
jgi:tetratricopeptide (TPR) repeat protein